MGLYLSHIDSVAIKDQRSLYIYLLDYGWPDGQWEQLFKRHFMRMADRAPQTGAVVIGSMRGVHFANNVLNWHKVGHLNADEVLPGLLYYEDTSELFQRELRRYSANRSGAYGFSGDSSETALQGRDGFLARDRGRLFRFGARTESEELQIADSDVRKRSEGLRRLARAIEVKPGAFGFSVDLKALLLDSK